MAVPHHPQSSPGYGGPKERMSGLRPVHLLRVFRETPYKIQRTWEFPPLRIKSLLESDPSKPKLLVGGLGIRVRPFPVSGGQPPPPEPKPGNRVYSNTNDDTNDNNNNDNNNDNNNNNDNIGKTVFGPGVTHRLWWQDTTTRHGAVQDSTVQCRIVQHSASTVQYGTVQYSTVQIWISYDGWLIRPIMFPYTAHRMSRTLMPVCENNTPLEKKTPEQITLNSSKLGAGEESLLLFGRTQLAWGTIHIIILLSFSSLLLLLLSLLFLLSLLLVAALWLLARTTPNRGLQRSFCIYTYVYIYIYIYTHIYIYICIYAYVAGLHRQGSPKRSVFS